ncbi:hypothetical protein GCM10009827_060860 [Dactylosporangium maewongense]|uniref:ATP-binding protein n=1 Tax=Dactylosporangium maewongense TaxID=634393 RepID=A0ABN2B8Y6_9ACTN
MTREDLQATVFTDPLEVLATATPPPAPSTPREDTSTAATHRWRVQVGDDVVMTSHDGRQLTASGITVWPNLMAVRSRPLMYFGVDRHDPALPGQVLRWTVHQAAADPQSLVSRVDVVIESDLVFSVRDNGVGLSVDRIRPQREPWVAEALTAFFGPGPCPAGTGLAMVTALCTAVVADVWRDGRHYRQWADWRYPPPQLQVLDETEEHGTEVLAHLDGAYFGPHARLPLDPAELLSDPSGDFTVPSGVDVTVIDRRRVRAADTDA